METVVESLIPSVAGQDQTWVPEGYYWDAYRLIAVEHKDACPEELGASLQALGTQPDSLVPPVLPGPALPSAAASRAARAVCKVEGCQRLLRDEKPYYQRFLVCEEHMRCLSIEVNGQLCRFCQQCGKFEPVEAFDSNKRSCRARLQEHNKRRRKMGVNSRSMRKNRRNAAANKTGEAAQAEDSAAADAADQQAAEGAALDAVMEPADEAAEAAIAPVAAVTNSAVTNGEAAAASASSGSCEGSGGQQGAEQTQASGSSSAAANAADSPPAQQGPGSTPAAGVSTGCSLSQPPQHQQQQQQQEPQQESQQQHPQLPDLQPLQTAVPAATSLARAASNADDALLPAAGWAAEATVCWGGLLGNLHSGDDPHQQQSLQFVPEQPTQAPIKHEQDQQQQQHMQERRAWSVAQDQPTPMPESPTISDLMADIPMQDASELLSADAASQAPALLMPTAGVYEASLLYQPAATTPQLPAATRGSSSHLGVSSPRATGMPLTEQHLDCGLQVGQTSDKLEQGLQPLGVLTRKRHGSSCCSSSSAAIHDANAKPAVDGSAEAAGDTAAGAAAGAARAPAAAAAAVEPSRNFTAEDMRLLDELLNESANLIGAALHPCAEVVPTAAAAPAKRQRANQMVPCAWPPSQQLQPDLSGNLLPLSSAACADPAMPLPCVSLPPIVHRDDSAEDNRLMGYGNGSNSSSDSGGSSIQRFKKRASSGSRRAAQHTAQEVQAVQLMQQQAQYNSLQALQQHQAGLCWPATQAGPQQAPPLAMATSGAATACTADNHAANTQQDMPVNQQLQQVMLQASMAAAAQQQQQQQQQQSFAPAAAVAAAAAMQHRSSSFLGAHGSASFWGLPAAAFSAMQQQQQQLLYQQQQHLALQSCGVFASAGGMTAAGLTGGLSNAYPSGVMPGSMQWGRDAVGGSLPQWPPANLGMSQQQHQPYLQQQQQLLQQQALANAMAIAQGGGVNASYQPVDASLRMSVKIHGAEPTQLEPEMLPRLNSLFGSSAAAAGSTDSGSNAQQAAAAGGKQGPQIEVGYMRPGCVHLVLQLRTAADLKTAAEVLAAAAQGLDVSSWQWALLKSGAAAASAGGAVTTTDDSLQQQQQGLSLTVQVGDQSVLLIRDGKPDNEGAAVLQCLLQQGPGATPLQLSETSSSHHPVPQLHAVLPCCISSRSSAVVDGCCNLLAIGTGLGAATSTAAAAGVAHTQSMPVARCQGMFLGVEAVPASPMQAAAMSQLLHHATRTRTSSTNGGPEPRAAADAAADGGVALVVQGLQAHGLVHIEFMQGALLSNAQPLLVVEDDAVAAELQGLQAAIMAGGQRQAEAQQVLVDFGRLLDFQAASIRHAGAAEPEGAMEGLRRQEAVGRRRSSSAPMPHIWRSPAAAAAAAEDTSQTCDGVLRVGSSGQLQASSAAAELTAQHSGSYASSAGCAAAAADAGTSTSLSKAPSRNSSSSSLREMRRHLFALPCFGASRRTGSSSGEAGSSNNSSFSRGCSLALETTSREPTEDARNYTHGLDRSSVPCLPTRRRGASSRSSSFSRRISFGFEAAVPEGVDMPAPVLGANDAHTADRAAPVAPATPNLCLGSFSSQASSSGSINRRHSFAVETAGRGVQVQHGSAAEVDAGRDVGMVPSRRKSFGDFVSRSRSFRALTRSLTRGRWRQEEDQQQQQQQQQHGDVGLVCPSGASYASRPSLSSDPESAALECQQRAEQAMRLGSGDRLAGAVEDSMQGLQLQEERVIAAENGIDAASEEGDSVSSVTAGHKLPHMVPAVPRHPLLTVEYKGHMMDVGARLLCFFLDRGWPASARMVLTTLLEHAAPVVSFPAISAAVSASCGEGLGLLHRAVRSGQLSTVTEVLGWGVQHRTCLPWDAKGPQGLTPLHLLALSAGRRSSWCAPGSAAADLSAVQPSLAALILHASPGLSGLWFNLRDNSGMTPALYASSVGAESTNQLASSWILLQESRAASHAAPPGSMPSPASIVPVANGAAASSASAAEQHAGDPVGSQASTGMADAAVVLPMLQAPIAQALSTSDSSRVVAVLELPDAADAQLAAGGSYSDISPASQATHPADKAGNDNAEAAACMGPSHTCAANSTAVTTAEQPACSAQPCRQPLVGASAASTAVHNANTADASAAGADASDSGSAGAASMAGSAVAAAAAVGIAAAAAAHDSSSQARKAEHVPQQPNLQDQHQPATAQQGQLGQQPPTPARQKQTLHPQQHISPAVVALAQLLGGCQRLLDASARLRHGLWVLLTALRVVWVVLLLKAVLHGCIGLMLTSMSGFTAATMLGRLLCVLMQPKLKASLTNPAELRQQLRLLLTCVCSPLPQPHSCLLLTFDSEPLEEQYKQVLSESRQQVDVAISGIIKGLISALPLLLRCDRCQLPIVQLLVAPGKHWSLPTLHLLAAAFVAGAPLIAALVRPSSYHSVRDTVLFASQMLLLVMLRKPLLAAAAAGSTAAAAAAASSGVVARAQLFHGCVAALLLLLFRQRLCWAAVQALIDAAVGLVLLCCEWWAGGALPAWHGCLWTLLHVLLPVLVLPMLYIREKLHRQMVLASGLPRSRWSSRRTRSCEVG